MDEIKESRGRQIPMKRFFCIALALTSIIAQASPAQAQGNSVESKIIAIEKAWNQAYKFRDKKALSLILHDSIVLVNDDGSLQPKGSFLDSIDAAGASDEQQADPESISVHVFGNVAIATGVFREKRTANGKTHVLRLRFVDTWISQGESWACVAASATPVR
jgi:ketosteroid isomerase-like protein